MSQNEVLVGLLGKEKMKGYRKNLLIKKFTTEQLNLSKFLLTECTCICKGCNQLDKETSKCNALRLLNDYTWIIDKINSIA